VSPDSLTSDTDQATSNQPSALSMMHAMSYNPKKLSKSKISNIAQIEYRIDADIGGFIKIHAFNNLRQIGDNNPYYWRTIPNHYFDALSRALYRLEILKIASKDSKSFGGNLLHIETAQRHLALLDTVLDTLWSESFGLFEEKTMTEDWRCKPLDEWTQADDVSTSDAHEWVTGGKWSWDISRLKQDHDTTDVARYVAAYFTNIENPDGHRHKHSLSVSSAHEEPSAKTMRISNARVLPPHISQEQTEVIGLFYQLGLDEQDDDNTPLIFPTLRNEGEYILIIYIYIHIIM
jgi:hypothetical protein